MPQGGYPIPPAELVVGPFGGELNKSSFSNGLDLRNKYAHSTYPEDEKIQFVDYIRLLKIMILVITKINEEFCLRGE